MIIASNNVMASTQCSEVYAGIEYDTWEAWDGPFLKRYSRPRDRYVTKCRTTYGAFSLNPQTRAIHFAWDFNTPKSAIEFTEANCGKSCVGDSFESDYLWIAMGKTTSWATSTGSQADAVQKCNKLNDGTCTVIWVASSTAKPDIWYFKSVAFSPKTGGSSIASSIFLYKEAAERAALTACADPGCWAFTFQGAVGAIAMSSDGRLWGMSSNDAVSGSSKSALNYCIKESGTTDCSVKITMDSDPPLINNIAAKQQHVYFKAVAFSRETGRRAISNDQLLNKEAAEQAALAVCAAPDCWAYTFQGPAGAIAMSSDGRLWGAWADDVESGASQKALALCQKESGDKDCKVQIATDSDGLNAELERLDEIAGRMKK